MGYVRCQPVPGSQIVQWGCIKFRLLFRPSTTDITIRYTTSSIHSNMWWKNQNRAERQFTQNSVRTEARKNLPENVMLLRGETGQNTTALIELVQVQGAHGKAARPLRLMGHLKRLHNRKNPSREKKTRQEIWVGSMAYALKSPSYKGYTAGRSLPLFTRQHGKL